MPTLDHTTDAKLDNFRLHLTDALIQGGQGQEAVVYLESNTFGNRFVGNQFHGTDGHSPAMHIQGGGHVINDNHLADGFQDLGCAYFGPDKVRDIVFAGNYISTGGPCILIEGTGVEFEESEHILIQGNWMTSFGNTETMIDIGSDVKGVFIDGNMLKMWDFGSAQTGIGVANGAEQIRIGENHFINDTGHVEVDNNAGTELIDRTLIEQTFFKSGALVAGAGTFEWPVRGNRRIEAIYFHVAGAPSGGPMWIDVNVGGTTLFTTQANRPTVADGVKTSADATPDITALSDGDLVTIDIDSDSGSPNGASDLLVTILHRLV